LTSFALALESRAGAACPQWLLGTNECENDNEKVYSCHIINTHNMRKIFFRPFFHLGHTTTF